MGEPLSFGELMTQWAVAVARRLVSLLGDGAHECWIGRDRAIYLRYRHGDEAMGTRIDDLVTDRLTGACLAALAADAVLATAETQAANYYDELWSVGAHSEWTDDEGRAWWGNRPRDEWGPADWRAAVGADAVVVIDVG